MDYLVSLDLQDFLDHLALQEITAYQEIQDLKDLAEERDNRVSRVKQAQAGLRERWASQVSRGSLGDWV